RRQNINYVKLRGLVSRFMTLNPEADPEAIDWTAVYDDSLSYDELVEAFEKEYPMYRWRETAPADDKQIEDMLVNHILNQVEDLTEESLKSLVNALEERLEALRQAETPASPTEQQPEHTQMQHPQQQPLTMTETIQQPAPTPPKVTLRLLASYPFLSEAREVIKGVSFEGLPEAVYRRARGRIIEALERGELGVIPRLDESFVELLSFPVAKATIHTIDDDWLKRRWALAEAARVERLLLQENDDLFQFLLSRLLEVRREGEEFAIHFTSYLKLVEDLTRELSWKLVNQKLARGWVFLSKTRLIRLIRQKLYRLLYDSFSETPKLTKIPKELAEVISDITEELQKIKARQPRTPVKGLMPPCMKAIADRLADASHTENFVLAAYLSSVGYSVEEIVDVFRTRADFDPKIARYQVEHIAGLRGSRVKYRPPSCQRMKELGLCIENGRYCPSNIRNPLQYRPKQRQPT
ncbi:MAG: hypothetical protein QW318_09530, partial [Candidatus Caldarchaeum sp.]